MQTDVDAVRSAIAERHGGRGKRYAPALRQQIVETTRLLRDGGWKWQAISEALGLSEKALRGLMGRWEEREQAADVRPVHVVSPARPRATSKLTLTSPTGWRIEGLTVDTAAALLAKLPC